MTFVSSDARLIRPFSYLSPSISFPFGTTDSDGPSALLMPEGAQCLTFGGILIAQGTGSSILTVTPRLNVLAGAILAGDLVADQTDPITSTLYTSNGVEGVRVAEDGQRVYLVWTYDVGPTAGPTLAFWEYMLL